MMNVGLKAYFVRLRKIKLTRPLSYLPYSGIWELATQYRFAYYVGVVKCQFY